LKRKQVSLIQPRIVTKGSTAGNALLEGAILGSYSFSKYKSDKPETVETVEITGSVLAKNDIRRMATITDSVCFARDLINDNAGEVHPERLAREARAIAAHSKSITCTILTEKEIQRKGLGLLYAVGQASPFPPRLILVHYTGARSTKRISAIVGKGITFDSGGQNLKSDKYMDNMRTDMAGAAAVLGTMKALAGLNPAINVVGVIPAAHNAIGSRAYFPGDVYTSYCGKTVEILNTDAEGRLVLADAISYCIKHFKPARIIDCATLTGSIITALGDTIAGLFSNNDTLAEALLKSGEKTGERLWRMPLCDEHRESMKSDIADLRNLSKLPRGHAGSITGAAFIEAFAEGLPWAHLDIAGTAFNEGEARGEIPKFGTGFGVRLLLDFLLQRPEK
jgi:leucyl aminopeptidase